MCIRDRPTTLVQNEVGRGLRTERMQGLSSSGTLEKRQASCSTGSRTLVPQPVTRSKRIHRRTAMQHVAIDLGGKESQLCARATDGSIVKEVRVSTKSLPKLLEAMELSL